MPETLTPIRAVAAASAIPTRTFDAPSWWHDWLEQISTPAHDLWAEAAAAHAQFLARRQRRAALESRAAPGEETLLWCDCCDESAPPP